MKNQRAGNVSIFLSVDEEHVYSYFNPHDPAPLSKRQLSQDFKEYLDVSIQDAGRTSVIDFKIFCNGSGNMRFIVDPLVHTIRRHFQIRKKMKQADFKKFKKRNYILLMLSFIVVMICQGLLPVLLGQDHRIHSMFSNAVDVFSWVILWKPIERLIFYWNPFLKEILIYDKIINAKINIVESEEELINYHLEHFDAA